MLPGIYQVLSHNPTAKENPPMKLGLNGLGRIGKLTLWHHVSRQYFS
jgi:hypothetical protein